MTSRLLTSFYALSVTVISSLTGQARAADYTIYEYGRECAQTMGVEVPTFSCDGPQSSRLKIEVNGQEVYNTPWKCDKPAYVGGPVQGGDDYSCTPNSRISKFSQHNVAGQEIVTVVACRATRSRDWSEGRYDNIGIVQSNMATKDTCWYQIRNSIVARNVPPAYQSGRQRGDGTDRYAQWLYVNPVELGQSDSNGCNRCHDTQVWLRSPWIKSDNQIPATNGNDNEIPQSFGVPHHVGWPFAAWNNQLRPQQVKINRAAYDQTFPPQGWEASELAAGHMAAADACTTCHAFGKHPSANSAQGSCNNFTRFFTQEKGDGWNYSAAGQRTTDYTYTFPHNAWMPPGASSRFSSNDDYQHYYYRAFQAVQNCCDNPWANGCHQ